MKMKIIPAMLLAAQVLFVRVSAQDASDSTKAVINISFFEKDSLRQVKATVTEVAPNGTVSPVSDVEVHIYAKKSFGLLPLGEGLTTDENGEVGADFPAGLPGDSLGNVSILARVEDNDELGELEALKTVKWGVPVRVDNTFHQRALWASRANAPLPLLVIANAALAGAWGFIIYIVLQLFKIKNIGKHENENQLSA